MFGLVCGVIVHTGRTPLSTFFFRLDMSSEQKIDIPESPTVPSLANIPECDSNQQQLVSQTGNDLSLGSRSLANLSSSSGNTEDSLTAYADRTLRALAAIDLHLDITFLIASDHVSQQTETVPLLIKASATNALVRDSKEICQLTGLPQVTVDQTDSADGDNAKVREYSFFPSEVEDLFNSVGLDI